MSSSLSSRPVAPSSSSPAFGPLSRRVEIVVLVVLFGWILIELLAQLHFVLHGTAIESVDAIFDDAYYYLGVAWNLANGHGSKFAEPLSTNGYHPLWLMIMATVSALLGLSKQGLVCAMLIITALIKLLGIGLAGLTGRNPAQRTFARLAMFAAIGLFPFVFSKGLETTLFIIVIPLLLATAKPPLWSDRRALLVGLFASLMFLSRLDSVALLVGVFVMRSLSGRFRLREWLITAAPLVATMAIYAAINLHFFGTPLPLSGQAKAIGSHFGRNLGTALEYLPSLAWTALMLLVWQLAKWRGARGETRWFEIGSVAITTVLGALYYGCMSSWPTWPWYQYPNAFLLIYSGLMAASAVLSLHAPAGGQRRPAPAVAWGLWAVLAVFLAWACLGQLRAQSMVWRYSARSLIGMKADQPNATTYNTQNIVLAQWLAAHYPNGAMLAMGDRAGGLGYWMGDRFQLIQLEGLVGDLDFLKSRREGTVGAYLDKQHVSVYVADRGYPLQTETVVGYVEPIQANFDDAPLTMFCFTKGSELLNQDYVRYGITSWRRVYDFSHRVECPKPLLEQAAAMQSTFGAMRASSVL